MGCRRANTSLSKTHSRLERISAAAAIASTMSDDPEATFASISSSELKLNGPVPTFSCLLLRTHTSHCHSIVSTLLSTGGLPQGKYADVEVPSDSFSWLQIICTALLSPLLLVGFILLALVWLITAPFRPWQHESAAYTQPASDSVRKNHSELTSDSTHVLMSCQST